MTRLKAHQPREGGRDILLTERAVAHFLSRHRRQIAAHCTPIACDVKTKLPLYDYDDAAETLERLARRARRVA